MDENVKIYRVRYHIFRMGRLQSRIAQVIFRITGSPLIGQALKGLEPYAGKLARTVLRGGRGEIPLTYPVSSLKNASIPNNIKFSHDNRQYSGSD